MSPHVPKRLPWFFSRGCALAFLAVLGYQVWVGVRGRLLSWDAAAHWVEVPCEILSVEGLAGGRRYDSLSLCYAYQYEGKQYTASRYDFWDSLFAKAENLEKEVQRLRNSPALNCYVNPAKPEEAVIEPSMNWGSYVFRTYGCGFFLLYCVRVLVRRRASARV